MGRYAELQKAWDENREKFRRLKEEMEKNEAAFRKIDQEMEAMEQEPIKDSDVVVMFSSQFETDYVVCKITDQSREWVKKNRWRPLPEWMRMRWEISMWKNISEIRAQR